LAAKSTSTTSELLDHAKQGNELKRSQPSTLTDVERLGVRAVIDAGVIRDILTGKADPPKGAPAKLDPKGLRIRGAWIRGKLDLDEISTTVGLELTGCRLDTPLTLRDATLHTLILDMCVLPAAWADRAKIDTLIIRDCRITANHAAGALGLTDAHVTVNLVLSGTEITNRVGLALAGTGLAVDAGAYLDGLRVPASGPGGAVCLAGATVGGDLVLHRAALDGGTGPALNGENLTVKGAALLEDFTGAGGGELGAVCLAGASIAKQLSLSGAALTGRGGPALGADILTVQGCLLMDAGCRAKGEGERAAVRLKGAKVTGDLRLDGVTIINTSGPALAADLVSVQGDLTMTGTGRPALGTPADDKAAGEQPPNLPNARGAAGWPAVQLRGASITGQLSLTGATVVSDGRRGGTVSTDSGAVCLSGATISGDLKLKDATLQSEIGPALLAEYLVVKGDAFRCEETKAAAYGAFRACGQGERGAVCLAGANISGQLTMRGAILTGHAGPALVADSVTVNGDMILDQEFTASGAGRLGTIRLRGATLNGRLSLDDSTLTCEVGDNPVGPAYYHGALYLTGATIGHDLLLRQATLTAAAGPALRADYLTIKGDAFHCEARGQGFTATGTGELGTLYLNAATLNGRLSLNDATLINESGPALLADSATILGSVLLGDGFTARGGTSPDGPDGALAPAVVSLVEASVGKELHCTGRAVRLQPGIAALDTQVGTLVLSRDFAAAREGEQDEAGLLSCDGLKYGQLPVLGAWNTRPPGGNGNKAETDQWISYLKSHTVYSAQAYQQLASAYHSLGEDDAARRILVAQRDQARGRLGPLNGFWQWVLGVLIGYGYQSVRALYWLAGLFAVTVVLTISWFGPSKLIQPVASTTTTTAAAGSAAAATPKPSSTATKTPVSSLTTTTATARQPCSFMGQLGYAVNVSFPIITIDTNSVQQCDVAAPDPNPALVVFGWLVKALASTLAVIYAAGLGGLTTRSPGS
jgi:hypothetical protein